MVNDPEVDGFAATYWHGDLYRCPVCRHAIVTGFGAPILAPFAVNKERSLQFGSVRPR